MAVVLMLAFFIGLEREEHKQREAKYAFGGIRTFPLIGLVSYALALMAPVDLLPSSSRDVKNPLELGAAFLFAVVFVAVMVLTDLARQHLGQAGLYSLAAILGVTDVDPFILGLAEKGRQLSPFVGARAIVIAAASNNVSKALYAYGFADRVTGPRVWCCSSDSPFSASCRSCGFD